MSNGSGEERSRRWLLHRAAATALGAMAAPAILTRAEAQQCPTSPINRPRRPVPDLIYNRANIIDTVAAVRPHREDGVRVEKMLPIGEGGQRRYLIHNYGHGGGGITLSFGCASVVADKVQEIIADLGGGDIRPSVAIIGTGIIGLTTADAIKRRFERLPITIYAKDIELSKTCSWVAGGQFEPSGIWRRHLSPPQKRNEMSEYLRRSVARIEQLRPRWSQYGIAERANFSLSEGIGGFDNDIVRPVIRGPRCGPLPFRNLSVQGREYGTWLVNPRILMPRLVRDLNDRGVYRQRRAVSGMLARYGVSQNFFAAVDEQIVINCTGLEAGRLADDPKVIPIKGQIVRIRNPDPSRYNYFFSGSSCEDFPNYMFCRQSDIVLGGTWEVGENNATANDNTAEAIMRRLRRLFGGNTAGC
ncbi:MAG: FAD-dependent oxidoreductase [Hyphomicrobium sp.]